MPAQTMTKLPSDSFWPGTYLNGDSRIPFPKLTSDSSTSIISPLTLPRGVAGYFDQVVSTNATTSHHLPTRHQSSSSALTLKAGEMPYSPLSPGIRGPALNANSFLSPHLLPSSALDHSQLGQPRSSSLPPTAMSHMTSPRAMANGAHSNSESTKGPTSNGRKSPTYGGVLRLSLPSVGQPRSVSGDRLSAPSRDQMVQRLTEQNKRLREAWEAERKYLQANRERAEEVYQEERALMEEERLEWEAERLALLQKIERLQYALITPPREISPVEANGMHALSRTSSNTDHRRRTRGSPRTGPNGSLSSQGSSQLGVQRGMPTRSNGNISLEIPGPRSPNGTSTPTPDFLKSRNGSDPVPVVDVQDIHPELEGIRLKATSVQSSFTAAKSELTAAKSQNGSGASSKSGGSQSSASPTASDQGKSPSVKKEQTLQALAANVTERLTMHAGHTPNHSLSSIATVASSGTTTKTSNGGDSTPTLHQDVVNATYSATAGANGRSDFDHSSAQVEDAANAHDQLYADEPEPMYEPSEDRPLTGPLMVRNMPIHDEIFFRKLNNKLEEVIQDDNTARPSVLQDEPLDDPAEGPAEQLKAEEQEQIAVGSGDESEGSKGSPKSGEEEDLVEIPLKLKTCSNFGAPFGQLRR